jgi:hypothetical protein
MPLHTLISSAQLICALGDLELHGILLYPKLRDTGYWKILYLSFLPLSKKQKLAFNPNRRRQAFSIQHTFVAL